MIDIEKIKPEIIERLKPLKPDKIILFGSHANGTATEDSDIDLFLIKDDLELDKSTEYEIEAKKRLRDIIFKYSTGGIDILSASMSYVETREDYFYKIEILKNGKVWYEHNSV